MPTIRSLASKYCTLFISSIILNSEIISPCSYYMKKGLVYIIITDLFSYQPSFCSKYTKLNTYMLYNMHSVSFNKYIFFICFNSL